MLPESSRHRTIRAPWKGPYESSASTTGSTEIGHSPRRLKVEPLMRYDVVAERILAAL